MPYQLYQLFLDNYYNKQTDVKQTDVKHSAMACCLAAAFFS